ncbi:MAG: ribonuclease J [Bacilli bacterium]|jgi:ribonuclease J|nr:ribonuclease J [Bacilli bacterium]
MAELVKFFALGGLDENGKNLYILEAGPDIFILECGAKYPDKTHPGIDLIIPNYDYLKMNKSRVRAYIITHGHDDQMGSLPFIYRDIPAPIYASYATIMMIKRLTQRLHLDVQYDFKEIKPSDQVKIAGRPVYFFQTCHAMMLSSGVGITTDQGVVVYSGDYIIEYNANVNYKHDLNALAQIAEQPILALLTESLGADKPGYTSPTHRITPHLLRPFMDAEGRIFIATFNQSTYMLEEIIALAIKMNKKIMFYDQNVAQYFNDFNAIGKLNIPPYNLISSDNLLRTKASDLVVLMMGQGDHIYNQIDLLANSEHEDKRIILTSSDTFIVAAPAGPSFEVLATNAVDNLYRAGVKVVNIGRKQISNMHAQEEDLKLLIEMLNPKYYIPVKGDFRFLMANARLAASMNVHLNHSNIFLLDNGMIVRFDDGKAKLLVGSLDKLPTGDLYVDGTGVGDISATVIEDRQKLSDDGVIVLALAISRKHRKIIAGPDVQTRGFVFVKENDNLVNELTNILTDTVNKHLAMATFNQEVCAQEVEEQAFRFVRRVTRKQPMILPLISEVE